jgi:hypothetical protein
MIVCVLWIALSEFLVQRLGNDDFQTRQKASEALLIVGNDSVIAKATTNPDLEIAHRSRRIAEARQVCYDKAEAIQEAARSWYNFYQEMIPFLMGKELEIIGTSDIPFLDIRRGNIITTTKVTNSITAFCIATLHDQGVVYIMRKGGWIDFRIPRRHK